MQNCYKLILHYYRKLIAEMRIAIARNFRIEFASPFIHRFFIIIIIILNYYCALEAFPKEAIRSQFMHLLPFYIVSRL